MHSAYDLSAHHESASVTGSSTPAAAAAPPSAAPSPSSLRSLGAARRVTAAVAGPVARCAARGLRGRTCASCSLRVALRSSVARVPAWPKATESAGQGRRERRRSLPSASKRRGPSSSRAQRAALSQWACLCSLCGGKRPHEPLLAVGRFDHARGTVERGESAGERGARGRGGGGDARRLRRRAGARGRGGGEAGGEAGGGSGEGAGVMLLLLLLLLLLWLRLRRRGSAIPNGGTATRQPGSAAREHASTDAGSATTAPRRSYC